jgi:Type IV secretory system Conjugative DNA transfer
LKSVDDTISANTLFAIKHGIYDRFKGRVDEIRNIFYMYVSDYLNAGYETPNLESLQEFCKDGKLDDELSYVLTLYQSAYITAFDVKELAYLRLKGFAVESDFDSASDDDVVPLALKKAAQSKVNDIQCGANFVMRMADKTRQSVIATLNGSLGWLSDGYVSESIASSTISLEDIINGEPMTVYIAVPPVNLNSHAPLLRMWIGIMLNAVATRRLRPENRTLFMLDEAAQLGTLDGLR